jgi:dTDP-glucose 4,6-dehydratase
LLVTGGAGFIGANFVRYWRSRHPRDEIVVLDALTYAGNRANLEGVADVRFVYGDIRDETLVRGLLRTLDTVVHFAAQTHVDRSIRSANLFVETNVLGTHTLLEAVKTTWLDSGGGRPHRFHDVSTDEVFGDLGPDEAAFREDTPFAPNSPYAASKAGADHLVRAYGRTYGLNVTTSHCSNNFGPLQFPEKLIPLFLINGLRGRRMPLYGDGLNVRDWLHVDDHCRGLELVIEKGRVGESYNIGGGRELANHDLVGRLCQVIDEAFRCEPALAERYPDAPAAGGRPTASLIQEVADRPGHDRRYAIDATKIASELGYAPATDFDAALRTAVQWYLDNEEWWRSSLARAKSLEG